MAKTYPKLCDNVPVLLITHLSRAGKREKRIQDAPIAYVFSVPRAFSTMPPATPTPSTYIQPS